MFKPDFKMKKSMLMRLWIKLKMLLMSIITLQKNSIRIESQDLNR
jgi:hypothetical protein